jgi:DNA-binding transcriptional regulator YiaG
VRHWGVGDKLPSDSSQKLLNLLERKGLEALI